MAFEYIDLNDPNITEIFRPKPASDPLKGYVAKVNEVRGEKRVDVSVDAVYRLISEGYGQDRRFAVRRSDGRNLAVKVVKGNVVDSMKRLHNATWSRF
tara:strand:+ start:1184 stop:1477 length:294 start_codon:yes stop_codon:yes gene_type:complete